MDEDTVLDSFELQSSGNICELIAVANGQRETLGSGHLNLFSPHLKAAQDKHTGESHGLIRLRSCEEIPQHEWFNKGTLKRFASFVRSPAILEWANSIDDEIIQLEQLKSTHLHQGANANLSTGQHSSGGYEKFNDKLQSPLYDMHDEAEASKKELLRALDVRLLALQHQQAAALNHAASAGFEHCKVRDLIAFSEHFGAEHLRAACNRFMRCCERREGAFLGSMEQAEILSGSEDQKDAFIGIHEQDIQFESHHVHQRRQEVLESGGNDSGEDQPLLVSAANMPVNKLHVDPAMKLFGEGPEQHEQHAKSHENVEGDLSSSTFERVSSSRSNTESDAHDEIQNAKGYGFMKDPLLCSCCESVSLSRDTERVNCAVDECYAIVKQKCRSREKGMLYERYIKLRDAKRLEEDHSKRAEKEARLKHLEESLEIAKVHMKALSSRRNRLFEMTAHKHATNKLKVWDMNEGQEGAWSARMWSVSPTRSAENSRILNGSWLSNLPSTKSLTVKERFEGTLSSQHSRSLSLSPMSRPRRTLVNGPSSQRYSSCDSSFGDLKNENIKGSHLKHGEGLHTAGKTTLFASNACKKSPPKSNATAENNATRSRAAKPDKKHQAALVRKSFDFRMPPKKEEASANSDNGMIFEPCGYSKLRQSSIVPIKEAKLIIQRGCSKQAVRRNTMKVPSHVKSSDVGHITPSVTDIVRNSDENAPPGREDHVNVDHTNNGNPSNKQSRYHLNGYDGIFVADSLENEVEALECSTVLEDLSIRNDAAENASFPVAGAVKYGHHAAQHLTDDQERLGSAVMKGDAVEDESAHNPTQFDQHAFAWRQNNRDGCSQHQLHNTSSLISTLASMSSVMDIKFSKASPKHMNCNDPCCPPSGHVRTRSVAFSGSEMPLTPEVEVVKASYSGLHKTSAVGSSKEPSKGLKKLFTFSWKNCPIGPLALESMNLLDQDQDSESLAASYKSQKRKPDQSMLASLPAPPTGFKLRDGLTCDTISIKGPRSFFGASPFRGKPKKGHQIVHSVGS